MRSRPLRCSVGIVGVAPHPSRQLRITYGAALNKSFEEWGEIFGDEVMAGALIDRLVHHCHIVNIRGNSYRMRQHAELYNVLTRKGDAAVPKRRRVREATTP